MAIRIGISSCLLGMNVRYDGGHKAWPLAGPLAQAGVRFIPLCPEAECGLGVPREPMRLEGEPACPVLKTLVSRVDQTHRVMDWSVKRLESLAGEGVRGFLLKSRSPSCGVSEVPIHDAHGGAKPQGMGIFARACQNRFPDLLLVEADKIADWQTAQAFLAHLVLIDKGREGGC